DPANRRKTMIDFFNRVYQAVCPGGLFIFDIAEPGRGSGPGPHWKHFQGEDWAVLVEIEEDEMEAILTRRITSFRRVGQSYRRTEGIPRLRLYQGREIAASLRRLGWHVRLVRGYGTFRFPKGLMGIVARKSDR